MKTRISINVRLPNPSGYNTLLYRLVICPKLCASLHWLGEVDQLTWTQITGRNEKVYFFANHKNCIRIKAGCWPKYLELERKFSHSAFDSRATSKALKDDSVDLTPIIFKTSMPHLVYGSVLAWRNSRCDLMMGDTLILEIFNAVMLMITELNIT